MKMDQKSLVIEELQQQEDSRQREDIKQQEDTNQQEDTLGIVKKSVLLVTFVLCLVLSIAGLATGIYAYLVGISCISYLPRNAFYDQQQYVKDSCNTFPMLSSSISKVFTLLFTVIIVVSTECLGYIHSISLRWALAKEGRLEFNSNLRLFSPAHTSFSNGRIVNVLSTLCLILCYAGASCTITETSGLTNGNAPGLLSIRLYPLGAIAATAGLLGLCIITGIAWLAGERSGTIKSWNPSPLNTTLACLHHSILFRNAGRSSLNASQRQRQVVHDCSACLHHNLLLQHAGRSIPNTSQQQRQVICDCPRRLEDIQPSTLQTVPALRHINRLAIVVSCITLSVACILLVTVRVLFRPGYCDRNPGSCGFVWFFFPNVTHKYLGASTNLLDLDLVGSLGLIVPILWSFLWQSISTITFHAIELVINLHRDETCWRRAANKGATFGQNAFFAAVSNKGSVALFFLKPVGQWLYTLGFYSAGDIVVGANPLPLFVLSVPLGLMTLTTIMTSRHRPKGSLPSTYGHLQTIADIIDDWGEGAKGKLYWGDKGEVTMDYEDRVVMCRHAGTAGDKRQVGEIRLTEEYSMY